MIGDFVQRTSASAFVFGVCDCVLWPADLVLEVTGVDPAAQFRGQYDSFISYRHLLTRQGGMLRLCDKMMDGFKTGEVENGVGLVRLPNGQLAGGILSAGRFIIKTKRGVVSPTQFNLVRGWTLCQQS